MALASVGPYRVLEHLGAGANGEVCLAEDTRLRRRVALKTLSGTAAADGSELRRRLLREARAAARLNHPHIAAVYDVLESGEGIHIVMEYVRGTTLATRIRQGPPTPMQVVDIALQLASALVHAHSLGVIHRDLKPANIVISADGSTKVLDFGLARLCEVDAGSVPLSGSSELSVDGRHVVGTPPYIPPEHLSGAPVDARGDVYSLGVTLYELLTGRRPFEASNGMGLTQAILNAPTPRVRSSCPECPSGLDEIVHRAMSRNPSDRYASAADLLADLKRLSAGITDVPTQSRPSPLFDARNRRPAAWTAAAIVAAVMASLGLAGRSQWSTAGTPAAASTGVKVVAVLPLGGGAGDLQNEALAVGFADTLITTLSRVPGLTVVSRASTLKYQERKADPETIARELGATMLVDGTLQRSGERLRISLSLLQPGVKTALWQSTSDGTLAEVFDLQREVAEVVAAKLSLPEPSRAGSERPTGDAEAFADYAQARSFIERPDIKENLDRGITLYQSAIARDSRFARAHAGLGDAYWRKYQATRDEKWSVQARDEINEALRLDPNDVTVRLSLATIYRGMGRMKEAEEELRKVIAAMPYLDEARRQLGSLLVNKGDHDRGIAELEQAIQLRPHFWSNHASLGLAFYNLGRYPAAAKSFKRITELQPDSHWGYGMLGSTYLAMDDTAMAADLFEKAASLGSTTAHGNLGMLQYGLRQYEEAVRNYSEAIRRDPGSPLLHLQLGDTYVRLGRIAEAQAEYRRALQLNQAQVRVTPTDMRALARLAVIESKLGKARDAADHIQQAVARAPTTADVLFYKAVIDVRAGRIDDAISSLSRAVQAGYSRKRAGSDPDLATLRSHAEFSTLIAGNISRGGDP